MKGKVASCKQFFERFLFACLDLKLPRLNLHHSRTKKGCRRKCRLRQNLPVFWGFPRCDAVDWLDVWPCPKKTGPMEWTCITKPAISECWSHIRCSPHASESGPELESPRWDHGISKNPRLLASQMSEGVKGESGDWQRQGGKKRWATSLAREWQKMGQHEGGNTISITVRATIGKTLAVELEEGKPHILVAIWHHLLLVVHSLNRGGTSYRFDR